MRNEKMKLVFRLAAALPLVLRAPAAAEASIPSWSKEAHALKTLPADHRTACWELLAEKDTVRILGSLLDKIDNDSQDDIRVSSYIRNDKGNEAENERDIDITQKNYLNEIDALRKSMLAVLNPSLISSIINPKFGEPPGPNVDPPVEHPLWNAHTENVRQIAFGIVYAIEYKEALSIFLKPAVKNLLRDISCEPDDIPPDDYTPSPDKHSSITVEVSASPATAERAIRSLPAASLTA